MVTIRPPKTIVKPTALGPVANTDTKLLIYSLFQQGRVLAQDGDEPVCRMLPIATSLYYEHKAREKDPSRLPARAKRDRLVELWIPGIERFSLSKESKSASSP